MKSIDDDHGKKDGNETTEGEDNHEQEEREERQRAGDAICYEWHKEELLKGQKATEEILDETGFKNLWRDPTDQRISDAFDRVRPYYDRLDPVRKKCLENALIDVLKGLKKRGAAGIVKIGLNPPGEKSAKKQEMVEGAKGEAVMFENLKPFEGEVCGGDLLEELMIAVRKYCILPQWGLEAAALWILHTYCFMAFDITPRLAVVSPTKRCGKSKLLDVLSLLVWRPLLASNVSPAVVFRAVEQFRPSMLIDECDTFLKDRSDGDNALRGILNSGHSRTGSVMRMVSVGDDFELRKFSTFAPTVIAMIGRLPATLADRSIKIPMSRKGSREDVDRLRVPVAYREFQGLRSACLRWGRDHKQDLMEHDPEVPTGLDDRAIDNWVSLLSIAEICGEGWDTQARLTAQALSACRAEDEDSWGDLLLKDLAAFFEQVGEAQVPTSQILTHLHGLGSDRPWEEFGRAGKPMTARQMANQLRSFGIRPRNIRTDSGSVPKGYRTADFEEVFTRYVPKPDPEKS